MNDDKIAKTWTEHYYKHPEGYLFYRPGKTENLIKVEVTCTMLNDTDNNQFTAFCSDSSGGPIISGATIEECEKKFTEAFVLSLFVGGLMTVDKNDIEKILREFVIENPQYLTEYKSGNAGLIGLFVGHIMKLRKGKGDPKMILEITKNFLDNL